MEEVASGVQIYLEPDLLDIKRQYSTDQTVVQEEKASLWYAQKSVPGSVQSRHQGLSRIEFPERNRW